jgi:hypothetical protein
MLSGTSRHQETTTMIDPARRRTFTLILLACLAVSLFCVAYPIYVIRPFRHQGATELALALVVARFRPFLTAAAASCAVVVTIGYWRTGAPIWRRVLAGIGAALTIATVFLARVNVYELMFHPIDRPSFTAAKDTKLNDAEKVVAIRIGGEARAYPIRSMSYHHVVNDRLGGVAVAATY